MWVLLRGEEEGPRESVVGIPMGEISGEDW